MVLLIRDNECFEPRVKNYLQYYQKHNIAYHVIGWNRDGSANPDPKATYYQKPAQYGKMMGNFGKKVLWMLYVMKQIFHHRKTVNVVHACDYDVAIPAMLMCKLLGKKLIFDVFDWQENPSGKFGILAVIDWLENWVYRHADYVILCDEERKKQAKVDRETVHVLPNIPNFQVSFDKDLSQKLLQQRKSYRLTLSYVGALDANRGLENLLECTAGQPDVLLNIAGFGMHEALVEEYAREYPNVCWWGRVEYDRGQTIMKESDAIVAMYYLTNPVHKYAAPNKYFESLILGIPLITTENTAVGSKVSRFQTGFAIGQSQEAFDALLTDAAVKEKLNTMAKNCQSVWENHYASYYDNFMKQHYMEMIG